MSIWMGFYNFYNKNIFRVVFPMEKQCPTTTTHFWMLFIWIQKCVVVVRQEVFRRYIKRSVFLEAPAMFLL